MGLQSGIYPYRSPPFSDAIVTQNAAGNTKAAVYKYKACFRFTAVSFTGLQPFYISHSAEFHPPSLPSQ